MTAPARTVEVEGPVPEGRRVVARFEGVRHSTESFVVEVHVGDTVAGEIAMYGHGTVYGGQAELDAALAPYHADVDLTGALDRTGRPSGPLRLSLIVRGANGEVREPEMFRFSEVRLLSLP